MGVEYKVFDVILVHDGVLNLFIRSDLCLKLDKIGQTQNAMPRRIY